MKNIFDREDAPQSSRAIIKETEQDGEEQPVESEWDLQSHKQRYEDAMQQRQRHVEIMEARSKTEGMQGLVPQKTTVSKFPTGTT